MITNINGGSSGSAYAIKVAVDNVVSTTISTTINLTGGRGIWVGNVDGFKYSGTMTITSGKGIYNTASTYGMGDMSGFIVYNSGVGSNWIEFDGGKLTTLTGSVVDIAQVTNLSAGNIKNGVTILTVLGTYSGGGGGETSHTFA